MRNIFCNPQVTIPLAVVTAGALVFFALGRLGLTPAVSESGPPVAPRSGPAGSLVYFGPPNSVAVLPFRPGEAADDQAPEAFGLAAAVIRSLGRLPGLQVTARTSSFFFQAGSAPPKVIGERLQAAHLLSGELRLGGERAILEAKLYDTRRGTELWTREFEGAAGDLQPIRDSVVSAVAQTLRVDDVSAPPGSAPIDPEAWRYFLRGLYYDDQLGGSDPRAAIAAFERALARQPGYAPAWTGIADAWLSPAWPESADGPDAGHAMAAVEQALQADEESAAALGLLAHIRHRSDRDYPGAAEAARKAIEIQPNDPGLMGIASRALFTLGQFEEAESLLQASIRRDPLNLANRLSLGLLQEFSGEYENALTSYRVLLGLNPEFPGAHACRARVKVIQGKGDSALKESEEEIHPFWQDYSRVLALSALGRDQEAQAVLVRMQEEHARDAAFQLAELQAFRGEVDQAFEWLQRAWEQHDPGMGELKGNFFLNNLHEDPRWKEMLVKLRLPLD